MAPRGISKEQQRANEKRLKQQIRSVFLGLTALVLPLFVLLLWMAVEYRGLTDIAGFDQALAARSLANGEGWTSRVITPLGLSFHRDPAAHTPAFASPLFAAWEALWFKLFSPSERIAALASGLCWAGSAYLVFLLAWKWFNLLAAWVSILLFLANPHLLDLAVSGRPDCMTLLLLGLFLLLVSREPDGFGDRGFPWLACGLSGGVAACLAWNRFPATGLLWLCFSLYWFAWPYRAGMEKPLQHDQLRKTLFGTPWAWLRQRIAVRTAGLFSLSYALPLLLAALVTGMNLTTSSFPDLSRFMVTVGAGEESGWSFWRTLHTPAVLPSEWMLQHPMACLGLLSRSVTDGLNALSDQVHPLVLALFLLSLILPAGESGSLFRWAMIPVLLGHMATLAFTGLDLGSLAVWTPFLLIPGIGCFMNLFLRGTPSLHPPATSQRRHRPRPDPAPTSGSWLALAVVVLLLTGPFVLRILDGQRPSRLEPSLHMETLAAGGRSNGLILSTAPWVTAWYTGKTVIWMPQTRRGGERMIESYRSRITHLYFPRSRARIREDVPPPWWFFAMEYNQGLPMFLSGASSVPGEKLFHRADRPRK